MNVEVYYVVLALVLTGDLKRDGEPLPFNWPFDGFLPAFTSREAAERLRDEQFPSAQVIPVTKVSD